MKMDNKFLQQLTKIIEEIFDRKFDEKFDKKFDEKMAPIYEILKGLMDQTARTMIDVSELKLDMNEVKERLDGIDGHLDEIDETFDFHHRDITRLIRITPNMVADLFDLNKRVTQLEQAKK